MKTHSERFEQALWHCRVWSKAKVGVAGQQAERDLARGCQSTLMAAASGSEKQTIKKAVSKAFKTIHAVVINIFGGITQYREQERLSETRN